MAFSEIWAAPIGNATASPAVVPCARDIILLLPIFKTPDNVPPERGSRVPNWVWIDDVAPETYPSSVGVTLDALGSPFASVITALEAVTPIGDRTPAELATYQK